jgi:hypothetical protein
MTGCSFDLTIAEVYDDISQNKDSLRPAAEAPRAVPSYLEDREGGSDGQISR